VASIADRRLRAMSCAVASPVVDGDRSVHRTAAEIGGVTVAMAAAPVDPADGREVVGALICGALAGLTPPVAEA
jgi:hypothetical protein